MDVRDLGWCKSRRSVKFGVRVEVTVDWRKASRSVEQGDCVEVAVFESD